LKQRANSGKPNSKFGNGNPELSLLDITSGNKCAETIYPSPKALDLITKIISMPYYVYILECADKTLYTGITTDLDRRFSEHKKGKGGHYTRAHPPKKIRYFEKQPSRSRALKREAQIKRWPRSKKLALITSAAFSASLRFSPFCQNFCLYFSIMD